jgi:hypothetical protein
MQNAALVRDACWFSRNWLGSVFYNSFWLRCSSVQTNKQKKNHTEGTCSSSSTGAWAQGFMLTRQAVYHLSHTFSLFCSGYFRALSHILEIRIQADLDYNPPIYPSCCHWDYRCIPPHPTFFCWDGVLTNFLPRLALNLNPPYFSLLSKIGLQMWATGTQQVLGLFWNMLVSYKI